jgi:hypothetical protein
LREAASTLSRTNTETEAAVLEGALIVGASCDEGLEAEERSGSASPMSSNRILESSSSCRRITPPPAAPILLPNLTLTRKTTEVKPGCTHPLMGMR